MEFGGNSNNLEVSHVFKSYKAFSEGLKGTKLEGVTSPYIYVGTWKAMFGWHKEDMDLYSINYVHTGQPKFWYGVDLDSSGDFERYVNSNFREQVKSCSEFIRHKTTLIHPDNLLKNGVKLTRAI
jgi:jumonji domain-containing protein 2